MRDQFFVRALPDTHLTVSVFTKVSSRGQIHATQGNIDGYESFDKANKNSLRFSARYPREFLLDEMFQRSHGLRELQYCSQGFLQPTIT
jgi:hypothetical protein